jgi:putative ABC transport system substrate-binding protein
MKRREFVTLASCAAMRPLAVLSQQSGAPVIGFLHSASRESYAPMTTAFRQGLHETGYVEGENVVIEYRWADGRLERLPELAADLVRRRVSVIFTGGGSDPPLAVKAATPTIPIIFANGTDPVEAGLVASLNRPGSNITGITFLNNTLGGKELEVLHQLLLKPAAIALLLNPKLSTVKSQLEDLQTAGRTLNLQIRPFYAGTEPDFDGVFTSLVKLRAGGLVIGADAFFFSRYHQLVDLATRNSVPTIYPWREAVLAGGLVSYGASVTNAYHLAGNYAGRILKGDKPSDLPVQQSMKTELVMNLKTAKALGLTIPPTLLARADEVIE